MIIQHFMDSNNRDLLDAIKRDILKKVKEKAELVDLEQLLKVNINILAEHIINSDSPIKPIGISLDRITKERLDEYKKTLSLEKAKKIDRLGTTYHYLINVYEDLCAGEHHDERLITMLCNIAKLVH